VKVIKEYSLKAVRIKSAFFKHDETLFPLEKSDLNFHIQYGKKNESEESDVKKKINVENKEKKPRGAKK